MAPILDIKDIHIRYGGIHAIRGLSFSINKGEIVTLLGSNGAGKTSTLKAISGIVPISSGKIYLDDQRIDRWKAHKIVAHGLAQSPEGRLIFPEHTILENLELGAYLRKDHSEIANDMEYIYSLFPILKERYKQLAGTLSGGEQQMLAIGRAYMSKPKILLLDEPSLGIAPILVQTIFKAIQEINQAGTTILLVEQNAYAALKVANRGYVMQTGEIVMSGNAQDLIENDEIKKAYLGH